MEFCTVSYWQSLTITIFLSFSGGGERGASPEMLRGNSGAEFEGFAIVHNGDRTAVGCGPALRRCFENYVSS
jgi:hypothetical protein